MDVSQMPTIANPSLPTIADAERVESRARRAQRRLAPATLRAYRTNVAAFTDWCQRHGLAPLPATPELVATYAETLADGSCRPDCAACSAWHSAQSVASPRWQLWKRPKTIERAVAAIGKFHRINRPDDPAPTADGSVRDAVAGIVADLVERMKSVNDAPARPLADKQAPALRWQDARRMLATLGESIGDRRDAALLSVAVDSLARRSELVALDVADLELDADGFGSILIRSSKTDRLGESMNRALLPDTVRRVRAWLDVAGISSGPLFRSVKYGRAGRRLPAGELPRIWQRLADRAGISARFSGHSTRVGGCLELAERDFQLPEIMLAGGWKSPAMVARYARKADQKRTARKLAALQNRS